MLPGIDPNSLGALESLDLGDIETPDGRAHPVTATTPVTLNFDTGATSPVASSSAPDIIDPNSMLTALLGKMIGTNAGKRVLLYAIVIVVALILLTVSAFRLTSPSSQL